MLSQPETFSGLRVIIKTKIEKLNIQTSRGLKLTPIHGILKSMKAILKLHQKRILKKGMVLEIKLWEVTHSKSYPEKIKYSLVCIDPSREKKILMDNHSPKGSHYHIDTEEKIYKYEGIDQLLDDFKALVKNHMGVEL